MLQETIKKHVVTGEIIDLGQTLDANTPHHPSHPPFMYRITKSHGDTSYDGGVTASNDMFSMGTHIGTHIDGLGHIAKDGFVYGGQAAADAGDKLSGYHTIGIDKAAPIVGRGVLIDMAGFHGVDSMEGGQSISAQDLQAACARQGITVEAGDSVLIRTGWLKYWSDPKTYVGLHVGSPGPDHSAGIWMGERKIRCSGTDTLVYEKQPAMTLPVHVEFLVKRGIHIIECLNLDELAARRIYTFVFVALPLKIAGGTGSPIRPIAIC
jgi:kynurenine formamidase